MIIFKNFEGKILDAITDLLYLLNRGYTRKLALNTVSARYKLKSKERMILSRTVYPTKVCISRRNRLIRRINDLCDQVLCVDWYNVLITINSGLLDLDLFLASDGVLRDIRGIKGDTKKLCDVYKTTEVTLKALSSFSIKELVIFLEKNISYSAEYAREISYIADKYLKIPYHIFLSSSVDKDITKYEVISTSDSIIIDNAKKVFDLSYYTLNTIEKRVTVYAIPEDILFNSKLSSKVDS